MIIDLAYPEDIKCCLCIPIEEGMIILMLEIIIDGIIQILYGLAGIGMMKNKKL